MQNGSQKLVRTPHFQLLLCQYGSTYPHIRTWPWGCVPDHTSLNLSSSKLDSSWLHWVERRKFSCLLLFILGFCDYGYISMTFNTNGADKHIKVLGLFTPLWDIIWGFPGLGLACPLGETSLLQVGSKLSEGKFSHQPVCLTEGISARPSRKRSTVLLPVSHKW